MSSTGDMLGEMLHVAATGGINMEAETAEESRYYWKRIANALVDFFGNMGGENPITFKCGDSVLTITATSITATHGQARQVINSSGIDATMGNSELKVEAAKLALKQQSASFQIEVAAITAQQGGAKQVIDESGIKTTIGDSELAMGAESITAKHGQVQQVIDASGIDATMGDSGVKVETAKVNLKSQSSALQIDPAAISATAPQIKHN
jgi:hypothetical protein